MSKRLNEMNDGFTNAPQGFAGEETMEVVAYTKNDLATVDLLENLKNPSSSYYCSIIDDDTRASKIKIYNAVSTAGEQLLDHINEVLEIVDVAAHPVRLPDQNTGEIKDLLRTVLIAKDGTTYQAVSGGVVSSLQAIYAIVGAPSWIEEPLKIKVKQETTSNKFKVTTLELVE